jgi:hypothetical protein
MIVYNKLNNGPRERGGGANLKVGEEQSEFVTRPSDAFVGFLRRDGTQTAYIHPTMTMSGTTKTAICYP